MATVYRRWYRTIATWQWQRQHRLIMKWKHRRPTGSKAFRSAASSQLSGKFVMYSVDCQSRCTAISWPSTCFLSFVKAASTDSCSNSRQPTLHPLCVMALTRCMNSTVAILCSPTLLSLTSRIAPHCKHKACTRASAMHQNKPSSKAYISEQLSHCRFLRIFR